MLIKLEVENFRSIKYNQIFHTIERNYKRFPEHVHKHNNELSILKTSIIYGANGSGKTTLFKALYFIKMLATDPEYLISIECSKLLVPFRLDRKVEASPSVFKIDFIYENEIYAFEVHLQINTKTILFEELTLITKESDSSEKLIFRRELDGDKVKLTLLNGEQPELALILSTLLGKHQSVLSFSFFKGILIENARNWFNNKIEFIFPSYEFNDIAYLLSLKAEYLLLANELIKFSKTGIHRLKIEEVPSETYFGTENKEISNHLNLVLKDKEFHSFKDQNDNYCVAIKKIVSDKEQVIILRLLTIHLDNLNNEVIFELDQESKGTLVLLHLVPAFILSYGEGINYFIDDINTSLHPTLLRELINQYFTLNIGKAKGQIIFNSHEDYLLDESMIRQDEVWLVNKNSDGATEYTAFSSFKGIRHDLNWRKNYLSGMFGAIPFTENPPDIIFSNTIKSK